MPDHKWRISQTSSATTRESSDWPPPLLWPMRLSPCSDWWIRSPSVRPDKLQIWAVWHSLQSFSASSTGIEASATPPRTLATILHSFVLLWLGFVIMWYTDHILR